jgi:hypothetical protein
MFVKRFIYFYGKIDSRSGIACKGQRLVRHAGRVANVSGRPFPDVFQDKIEQTVRSFLPLLLFFRVAEKTVLKKVRDQGLRVSRKEAYVDTPQ